MALFGNKTSLSSFAVKLAAAAVVGVLVVGALTLGEEYLNGSSTSRDVDRAMQVTRETPLIRVVLAENPALEPKLRAAAEEEVRHPSKRPLPSLLFGMEVRRQYIIPTLRNADDASAIGAVKAMEVLVKYLQSTDLQMCRDFGVSGIQDPGRLDGRARELLQKALAAQEEAYRTGKTGPPQPALGDNQFFDLLVSAGYKDEDLERLSKAAKLGTREACDAAVKLYSTPAALPPAKGGALARWLLTVAQ